MATQLNIKDPETVRLAKSLAASSGRSVTAVIRSALERQQQAVDADDDRRRREIAELSAEFRRRMPAEWHGMTSKQIMDSIYKDDGSFA